MKNRLLALEQSLLPDAQSKLAEAKGYASQFGGSATTKAILAQLPDWIKDKIGMDPSGEIEFERNIYDTTSPVIWSRTQVAIDRMQPGTYAIFGARTADPQNPHNHNRDKFSTSQILIMMPKQVHTVEINFVKRFQDFNSFEQGLIAAGIAVRPGGFINYSKNYWDHITKMYTPQFSVEQRWNSSTSGLSNMMQMNPATEAIVKRHGGTVIGDYCQADDPRTAGTPGWCLAVSIHWLRFKKQGTGKFFEWLKTDEATQKFRFIMSRQAIVSGIAQDQSQTKKGVSKEADKDFQERAKTELAKYGLLRAVGSSPNGLYEANIRMADFNLPVDCIAGEKGRYNLMNFYKESTGGGHTVAAETLPNGGFNFMDPNFGEIQFKDVNGFRGFLNQIGREPGLNYLPITSCSIEKYN